MYATGISHACPCIYYAYAYTHMHTHTWTWNDMHIYTHPAANVCTSEVHGSNGEGVAPHPPTPAAIACPSRALCPHPTCIPPQPHPPGKREDPAVPGPPPQTECDRPVPRCCSLRLHLRAWPPPPPQHCSGMGGGPGDPFCPKNYRKHHFGDFWPKPCRKKKQ